MTATLILFALGLTVTAYFFGRWSKYDKSPKDQTVTVNRIEIDCTTYEIALSEIRKYEGLRLTPYESGEHMYIGYGHQIREYEPYLLDGITEEYAEGLLRKDVEHRILTANKYYKLVGNRALAVAMLIYNIGDFRITKYTDSEGAKQFTTVHKMLSGWIEFDEAMFRASWVSFCKIDGKVNKKLQQRREAEVNIFFSR